MKNKNKITFSKVFWSVIITGIVAYVVLRAIFYYNLTRPNTHLETIEEVQKKLIKVSPTLFQTLSQLDKESQEEIKKIIEKKIDELYEPIYNRVDEYVQLHYSLKGDYAELLAGITKNFSSYLQRHIFGEDFEKRLQETINSINNDVLNILIQKSQKFKNQLQKLGLSKNEIDFLINKIIQFGIEDTKKRYLNTTNNLFRAEGVGAGIVSGAILGMKMATKQTAKVLAKKILAKIAIKTTTKIAAASASAATGAAEGTLIGGPIGAVVGGIVGGVIGWISTDMIVIKIDEFLHKEEFKQEIIKMIDKNKESTKNNLITLYTKISEEIFKENEKKLEELKNKKIKDIITNK